MGVNTTRNIITNFASSAGTKGFKLCTTFKLPKSVAVCLRAFHVLRQDTITTVTTTGALLNRGEDYGDEEDEEDDDGCVLVADWKERVGGGERTANMGGWEYGSRQMMS